MSSIGHTGRAPNLVMQNPEVAAEMQGILAKAGLERTSAGAVRIGDQVELVGNEKRVYGSHLAPPAPPPVQLDAQRLVGAETFAGNLDLALSTYLGGRSIADMNADSLLTAFLMLNVDDPSNSPETQNMLHQIASVMRQLGIDVAQKQGQNTQAARAEAEKYAQQAAVISTVVAVAGVVAAGFTIAGGIVAALAAKAAAAGTVTPAMVLSTVATETGNFAMKTALSMAAAELAGAAVDKASDGEADPVLKAVIQASASIGTSIAAPNVFSNTVTDTTQKIVERGHELAKTGLSQEQIIATIQKEMGPTLDPEVFTDANAFIESTAKAHGVGLDDSAFEQVKEVARKKLEKLQEQGMSEQALGRLVKEQNSEIVDEVLKLYKEANPDVGEEVIKQLRANLEDKLGGVLEQVLPPPPSSTEVWSSTLKNVGLSINVAAGMTESGVGIKETDMELDIAESRHHAKRFEFVADQHQDAIDNAGSQMQEFVESKNAVVEAVLSMQEQSFVAKQKLMAAQRSV